MDRTIMKSELVNGGLQRRYQFQNGYGASVINHKGSYGYPNKWELAVTNSDGGLCYDTPITDDVIGHLSEEQVLETLEQIKAL